MELTHGSLFSGIGGFDLGFERAGFKSLWQVEIDPYATKVLEKNFPDAKRFSDIRTVGKHNLATPTVITGGFPCQDISYVGTGKGLLGERSGLWKEMWRVVFELRPRFVVVENTAALLFRGMGRVLGELSEIGCDAEWEVISAEAIGAAHERERAFIVAYPKSLARLQASKTIMPVGTRRVASHHDCRLRWTEMAKPNWAIPESYTSRTIDGIPRRVERSKCLGNAIVPQIAEFIAYQIKGVLEQ